MKSLYMPKFHNEIRLYTLYCSNSLREFKIDQRQISSSSFTYTTLCTCCALARREFFIIAQQEDTMTESDLYFAKLIFLEISHFVRSSEQIAWENYMFTCTFTRLFRSCIMSYDTGMTQPHMSYNRQKKKRYPTTTCNVLWKIDVSNKNVVKDLCKFMGQSKQVHQLKLLHKITLMKNS